MVTAPYVLQLAKEQGYIDKKITSFRQIEGMMQTQAKLITSQTAAHKQLAVAENDRIKTANQLIGMQRTFGQLEKGVLEIIGNGLLPDVIAGYETLRVVLDKLIEDWEKNKESVEENVKRIVKFTGVILGLLAGMLFLS